MELDPRKKSKRDGIICSNIFETQEVREIGRKGAGEFRGFSILYVMDENNRRCLPGGRKEMQIPEKIENV